ncbi:MAG: glycosyltransferase family 4 protein [Thioalkalispiraceae bacterium]|jgi:glycosyltransferase involved in cell wall biosynthesis
MEIIYHHRTRGIWAEGAHIYETINAFQETGHHVCTVSPGASAKSHVSTNHKPQKIISLFKFISKYSPEFVFELLELLYNFIAYYKLATRIRKNKPDFIYERYSLFMFAGVYLARKKHIPIILEINDSAVVQRVRPLLFKRLARFIEKKIFHNCSGLVFISNQFKIEMEEAHGDIAESIILPNAANIKTFNPEDYDRDAMRKKLGIEHNVVCGYVGAFHKWHGIVWFVNEIIDLLKSHDQLVLLLVGDGPCFEQIESLVKQENLGDKIILTGRVAHDKVPAYISAMDFSILPSSNTYGSPMKLFELMSMGVAVVAPDYEPIKEVIEDAHTGWLFKKEDHKDCIEKVMEVSNDEQILITTGNNAMKYIRDERTWQNNTNEIVDFVSKLDSGYKV